MVSVRETKGRHSLLLPEAQRTSSSGREEALSRRSQHAAETGTWAPLRPGEATFPTVKG